MAALTSRGSAVAPRQFAGFFQGLGDAPRARALEAVEVVREVEQVLRLAFYETGSKFGGVSSLLFGVLVNELHHVDGAALRAILDFGHLRGGGSGGGGAKFTWAGQYCMPLYLAKTMSLVAKVASILISVFCVMLF